MMDEQKERIRRLTALYFEGIPFSAGTAEARRKIEAALQGEFARLAPELGADTAFESLVCRYPRLADMAQAAGYAPEEAENWRRTDQAKSLPFIKKQLGRQRRRIYALSLLFVFAFAEALWLVYDLLEAPAYALPVAAFLAALFGLGLWQLARFRRTERQAADWCYDLSAFSYLQQMRDRYAKRLLNSLPLSAGMLALFALSGLVFWGSGASKPQELAEALFANLFLAEVPLFLLLKNRLCLGLAAGRIGWPRREKAQKHLKGMALLAFCYWLASCLPFCLGWSPMTGFFLASAAAALLTGLYNLTLRRRIVEQNLMFNKRRAALFCAGAFL